MSAQYPPKSAFVAGYAQVPKGSVNYEQHKVIALVMVIDLETSKIVDADTNYDIDLINKYLCSKIVGMKIDEGIKNFINYTRNMTSFASMESFIQALKICYERYMEILKKNNAIDQS